MDFITIIDLSSLMFQIIGSWILFYNSPINEPNGTLIYNSDPDYNKLNKKNKRTKLGFMLLTIGLLIQFVNTLYKGLK